MLEPRCQKATKNGNHSQATGVQHPHKPLCTVMKPVSNYTLGCLSTTVSNFKTSCITFCTNIYTHTLIRYSERRLEWVRKCSYNEMNKNSTKHIDATNGRTSIFGISWQCELQRQDSILELPSEPCSYQSAVQWLLISQQITTVHICTAPCPVC